MHALNDHVRSLAKPALYDELESSLRGLLGPPFKRPAPALATLAARANYLLAVRDLLGHCSGKIDILTGLAFPVGFDPAGLPIVMQLMGAQFLSSFSFTLLTSLLSYYVIYQLRMESELTWIMLLLLVAGMMLDAVSIFLIFLPILVPVVNAFGWDMTWFAVLMTMNMAIGQFTPPMAVNLLVTTRVAGIGMEETVRWVLWLVLSMLGALALVAAFPQLALWLPGVLGY